MWGGWRRLCTAVKYYGGKFDVSGSCLGRVWVVLRRCGDGVRLAYGSPDTRPPDVPKSRGDGVRLAFGSPDTRPMNARRWCPARLRLAGHTTATLEMSRRGTPRRDKPRRVPEGHQLGQAAHCCPPQSGASIQRISRCAWLETSETLQKKRPQINESHSMTIWQTPKNQQNTTAILSYVK